MSDFNNSANMILPIPIPNIDPGPDYAYNINNSLTLIDAHDHSSGKGVQITPAGISVNSDFPMNGNNLTLIKSARFSSQLTPLAGVTDVGCLYESGVDLYFNDGLGNQIRITQGGSVAGSSGTITGLPSGTASAAYLSIPGTFQFQSATNTPANLDGASITIRNQSASANGVTVSAPAALGSNYSLVLPTLPASQKIMSLDASGNMAAPYSLDNVTLEFATNVAQVKDGGITIAKLAAVTTAQNATAGNVALSTVFTGGADGGQGQVGQTLTLVTTGRPVLLRCDGDAGAIGCFTISDTAGAGGLKQGFVEFYEGTSAGTQLSKQAVSAYNFSGSAIALAQVPASSVSKEVYLPAGTHTLTCYIQSPAVGQRIDAVNVIFSARET